MLQHLGRTGSSGSGGNLVIKKVGQVQLSLIFHWELLKSRTSPTYGDLKGPKHTMSTRTNFSPKVRGHARRGDDPDALALGEIVRTARIGAELTQDQLALASGVGRDTVIAIENGRGTVGLGKALQVIKALGLRIVPQERG